MKYIYRKRYEKEKNVIMTLFYDLFIENDVESFAWVNENLLRSISYE